MGLPGFEPGSGGPKPPMLGQATPQPLKKLTIYAIYKDFA